MGGGEDDAESRSDEHHGVASCVQSFGEEFGVPGVAMSGEGPCFLADGCGNDGVDVIGVIDRKKCGVDGGLNGEEGGVAALARGTMLEIAVGFSEDAEACRVLQFVHGASGDLRPDAAGFAERDADDGQVAHAV